MRGFLFAVGSTVLLLMNSAEAQQRMVMKFDPDSAFLLMEFPAVFVLDEGKLVVEMTAPAGARGEEYRDADLMKGDIVAMVNGTRIKGIEDLKKVYGGLEAGAEIKIALKRGLETVIVSFPKADPEEIQDGGTKLIIKSGEEEGADKDDAI